jgi:hypothetical protein
MAQTFFNIPAGSRILGEESIAVAFVLLKKCGIDVESKRIWKDRFYIYENIGNPIWTKKQLEQPN